jgi:type II secretory pathway component PulF
MLRRQAGRGPSPTQQAAARLLQFVEKGNSLQKAIEKQPGLFPPVFKAMAAVGEETGRLPEVLAQLESYYVMQQRFWRQFIRHSFYPVLLASMACAIVGGWLRIGSNGSLVGLIAAMACAYLVLTRWFGKDFVSGLLLSLPAIGSVMRSVCLARLSFTMALTLDSSLPVGRAVGLSFRATGNGVFARKGEVVEKALRAGDDLTKALARCRLLPAEFLNLVAVADQGGRVPEALAHEAGEYEARAFHQMRSLTQVAGFALWAVAAAVIGSTILIWAGVMTGRMTP